MKRYYRFSIMFILMLGCSRNPSVVEQYTPERLPVDSSILPRVLIVQDTIYLEENDEIIIPSISSASISQNGNYIAITAPNARMMVLYDYKTGKVLNHLISDVSLSDIYAKSGRKPQDYPEIGKYINMGFKNMEFITLNEWKQYEIDLQDTFLLNNMFTYASFINNQLFVMAIVYIQAINKITKIKSVHNAMMMLNFDDKFQISEYIPIENHIDNYAIPGDFFIDSNRNFYLTTSDFIRVSDYRKYDSLKIIGKYDSIGNIVETASFLPSFYTDYRIGYSVWYNPIIRDVNKDVFVIYPPDNKVYDLYGNEKWHFTNLPFSNMNAFSLFEEYRQLLRKRGSITQDPELLQRLFPILVSDAFVANDKLVVIFVVYDKERSPTGYYFMLQEYEADGRLISQTYLIDNPENRIQKFVYDSYNDFLVLMKKSSAGWTMERVKW